MSTTITEWNTNTSLRDTSSQMNITWCLWDMKHSSVYVQVWILLSWWSYVLNSCIHGRYILWRNDKLRVKTYDRCCAMASLGYNGPNGNCKSNYFYDVREFTFVARTNVQLKKKKRDVLFYCTKFWLGHFFIFWNWYWMRVRFLCLLRCI